MSKREPPILVRLIRPAVRALAAHERVPPERVEAYCANAESVLYSQIRAMYGGERVRFHAPTERTAQLDGKRQRIQAALASNERPSEIARRESVSLSWVYRLRNSTRRP